MTRGKPKRDKPTRDYRRSGERRFEAAKARLTKAVDSDTLPYLLAAFKPPYVTTAEFDLLINTACLIATIGSDLYFLTGSWPSGAPREMHEFIRSQTSRRKITELIDTAAAIEVLLQDHTPAEALPADPFETASLLTIYVSVLDL